MTENIFYLIVGNQPKFNEQIGILAKHGMKISESDIITDTSTMKHLDSTIDKAKRTNKNLIIMPLYNDRGRKKKNIDLERFNYLRNEKKMTLSKISKLFGINRKTLYVRLKENGYKNTKKKIK